MTDLTDPQPAADEVTTLREFLNYQRDVLRRKTEGLDEEQLGRSLPPTTMTLAGLLKHLAWVESYWLVEVFRGDEPGAPWAGVDWDSDGDWEWNSAVHDSPSNLRGLFDAAVANSDGVIEAALKSGSLNALASRDTSLGRVSLRWILVHLIEEYARHLGHADLLREAIDGSRGD